LGQVEVPIREKVPKGGINMATKKKAAKKTAKKKK